MNVGSIKQLGAPSIPVSIAPPQPMVDMTQAVQIKCECGSELFDEVYKLKNVSGLAPGNQTKKNVLIKISAYVCRECGSEYIV